MALSQRTRDDDSPCATPTREGWCGHPFLRHHGECYGGDGACPCDGFTPPGRVAHHVGVKDAVEQEWVDAIATLTPAAVARLLLEFDKDDAPRSAIIAVGEGPGARTLRMTGDRLVPILRADMERRMDKSSRQVGGGT